MKKRPSDFFAGVAVSEWGVAGKEEEQMKERLCDLCGVEVTEVRAEDMLSNLWVHLGDYSIKIDISKAGMLTHFCRDCRKKLVTHALSQDNPHFGLILFGDDEATEARKRKKRESYSFDAELLRPSA